MAYPILTSLALFLSTTSYYFYFSTDADPGTLRQTQVLVIPSNEDLMDFQVFDGLINAINQARRNARDYVTDVSLDKLDERMYGDGDTDWW